MITRNQLPSLFGTAMLPALDELIFNKFNRFSPQFSRYFSVKTSKREIEQTTQLSGLTLFNQIADAAAVRYDEPVKGFDKTYTHAQYALGFRASRTLVDDDRYSIISKMASDLGRSAKETVEIYAANYIINNTTGPDGVALFSTSHPLVKNGGTQSNRLGTSSDLDVVSLQLALTAFRKQVDSSGRKVRIQPQKLVVPSDLEWVASELMSGAMRADTANNTTNAFKNRDGFNAFSNFEVWDYLTDASKWYIWGSAEDTDIRWYWREQPNTIHDVDFDTRSIKTAMWMRFSFGHSDFYGVYGGF
jgi:hypothetical protein